MNISVLLKDVTSPIADSMPNQYLCSRKEEAPGGSSNNNKVTQAQGYRGVLGWLQVYIFAVKSTESTLRCIHRH